MASSQQRRLVADLHLHSRYSLATSPDLNVATLAETAMHKGIDLLAAPDFTHPAWRREMRAELVDADEGVFQQGYVGSSQKPYFILVTEMK